jgi:hypothetical protein
MAAKDYIATAASEDFAGRVIVLAFKVAMAVLAEGTAVANHTERVAYVKRVARGDDRPKLVAIHAIMYSAAIRAAIDAQPASVGSNVTDAEIEAALTAIWTARALAFV